MKGQGIKLLRINPKRLHVMKNMDSFIFMEYNKNTIAAKKNLKKYCQDLGNEKHPNYAGNQRFSLKLNTLTNQFT